MLKWSSLCLIYLNQTYDKKKQRPIGLKRKFQKFNMYTLTRLITYREIVETL